MKFVFKRKYTFVLILFLVLIGLSIAFYFVGPHMFDRDQNFFNQVLLFSILDSFLICILIIGFYRVNYYLYHDHLEIHRSLHKTISIDYPEVQSLVEFPHDKIVLFFGTRPSFKITYKTPNKIKKYRLWC